MSQEISPCKWLAWDYYSASKERLTDSSETSWFGLVFSCSLVDWSVLDLGSFVLCHFVCVLLDSFSACSVLDLALELQERYLVYHLS